MVEANPRYFLTYRTRWYTTKFLERAIGFDRSDRLRNVLL